MLPSSLMVFLKFLNIECVVEEDMFSSKPSKYIPASQSSHRHAEFKWCCQSNLTINIKQKFAKMQTTFKPSDSKITISIFAGLSCTRGNILEELGAPQLVRGRSVLFSLDIDYRMATKWSATWYWSAMWLAQWPLTISNFLHQDNMTPLPRPW